MTTTLLRDVDLFVYGHSWTNGYGLPDNSKRYPMLVAREMGCDFGDKDYWQRGANGAEAEQVLSNVYGSQGGKTWQVGTRGVVLVQALLNTLRIDGANPLYLETARNALRGICATLSASRRLEQDAATFTYGGTGWKTSGGYAEGSDGGGWKGSDDVGAYVQFPAVGREYVMLRGRPESNAATVRVTDETANETLATLNLSNRLHPAISQNGIAYGWKVPARCAGHTIRLTRTGGSGNMSLDVVLRQEANPIPIVLVKEPMLADWSTGAATKGSDAACAAFNALIDEVAREFPNVIPVDVEPYWDKQTMLLPDGTHPNEMGHEAISHAIEDALVVGLPLHSLRASVLV
jgi:hypothetical protein